MELAVAERSELAELLGSLTAEQWEAPSLCEGWRVRDVVAHMISYDDLSARDLVRRFVRGRIVHANQIGVDEARDLTPDQLLDRFRHHVVPQGLTAGLGGTIALVDGTIHQQDIRRPLGRPRQIPAERLVPVLDAVMRNPRLPAWRATRGLRLVASDIDWSHGKGAEVRGAAESLLMASAGRPSALGELAGPGLPLFARRLAH